MARLFSSPDTHRIISLKGRQLNNLVVQFQRIDDPFIATRFLAIPMAFVIRVNTLPEVNAIAKEKNSIIVNSNVTCDLEQLSLHKVVGI